MDDAHNLLFVFWGDVYPYEDYRDKNLPTLGEVLNRFPAAHRIRVLDLCCGTGRALSLFSESDRIDLYGIDQNDRMIEKAQQHLTSALET